ncbi:MAG: YggS family pyridoxal phosphate-dependent enzyme, partial [Crocinitomicaceae bacterium]|nr:YggS family pyridoxal phosphate-dependent enzyme [Crocinitomicaceae bacterium]
SEKASALPKDIQWHLIGHLQTNKVKYIAEFVHLIHAVDSLKLLQEINKQALKHSRVIACLLQFHIADEETKFGLSREEAKLLLSSESYSGLQNIKIIGVMGMASFVDDKNQIRNEFIALQAIFSEIKSDYFSDQTSFKEISMGMSGDFQLAIEEGSTMVRIGSSLFS